jgi:(p)ppGpp synthase/HD superfamily hydrolase
VSSHPTAPRLAYSSKLDEAAAFAAEKFRDKFRKQTTIPYLTHLWAVAALVGEHGGDEDQIIAALLHDVLEDCPDVKEADLRLRFGDRVTRYVVALSDTVSHPKPPWRERKEAYLLHLANESADLKLISCADKLHNCRSILRDHRAIGDVIFSRFNAPKHETLWYFRALADALGHGWEHLILVELREAVHDLHAVAQPPM